MSHVTIQRCVVRIVRKGGWSWGADPRALCDRVVRCLPGLLAGRLAGLARDHVGPTTIDAPVQIRLTVTMPELVEALEGGSDERILARSIVGERLGRALALALQPHLTANASATGTNGGIALAGPGTDAMGRELSPSTVGRGEAAVEFDPGPHPGSHAGDVRGSALVRLLRGWHSSGHLARSLAGFSPEVLRSWHEALAWLARGPEGHAGDGDRQGIGAEVEAALARHPSSDASSRSLLLRRIVVVFEAGPAAHVSPVDARLWRALDRALPRPDPASSVGVPAIGANQDAEGTPPGRPAWSAPPADTVATTPDRRPTNPAGGGGLGGIAGREPGASSRKAGRARPFIGTVQVESALPFLLLGPLAGAGCLEALSAAVEAAGWPEVLPSFAAALAYKVLPPSPLRGWRRHPSAPLAAAAFAGREAPVPEPDLIALCRRAGEVLDPIQAAASAALVKGHHRGEPLLLIRVPDDGAGWLLLDTSGLFPIAWSGAPGGLWDPIRLLDSELILIPGEGADPVLLREADDRGYRFVTDAPPARGETWRPFRWGRSRRWTNDAGTDPSDLGRKAARLDEMQAPAARTWHALAVERTAVPLAAARDLERSLAMVAGTALGQIAWSLWSERGLTDPLLALERFATLDARIRFEVDVVRVTLPLGRRSLDLASKGLLDDVRDVPWLGGRSVVFSKG